MKKRFWNLLLGVLLLSFAESVFAYSFRTGGINYNITSSTSKTVAVTYYSVTRSGSYSDGYTYTYESGYSGNVVIPSTVTYNGETYTVTAIGDDAFLDSYKTSTVTSVSIPSTVTSIGYSAFSGCTNITSINIPESVTSIGNYAFSNCASITSIFIPESSISVGYNAFYGCTGITYAEICCASVPQMEGCSNLTYIKLGEKVSTIGSSLSSCSKLAEVEIDQNNSSFLVSGGIVYNKEKTALILCPAAKESASILSTTKTIESNAFKGCNKIESLTIPYSVTTIGSSAFFGCSSLSYLSMPTTYISKIGESAFSGCRALNSITIPYNVTSIESGTFVICTELSNVKFATPYNVTSIGGSAFENCSKLASFDVPYYVSTIGNSAFRNCTSLERISLEKYGSLTSIGNYAFYMCSGLKNITLPNNLSTIGTDAFAGCTSLPITDNVRYADTYLVEAVDKTKQFYNIKSNTKFIGYGAFQNCKSLKSVVIPNSVVSLGNYAFHGADALSYIIVSWSTPIELPYYTFSANTFSQAKLYFTSSSYYTAYSSATRWKDFVSKQTLYKARSVSLNNSNLTIFIDRDVDLLATLTSAYSSYGTSIEDVVWSSSDESIASVSDNGTFGEIVNNWYYNRIKGLVHGKKPGVVTITASTLDGSNVNSSCTLTVKYANVIYNKDIRTRRGTRTVLLPVYMDNELSICNFQFDLLLPEGINIPYDEDEEMYLIDKGPRAKARHSVDCVPQVDGSYRILATSTGNIDFDDTDKSQPVMYIPLNVPEDIDFGEHEILMKSIKLNHYDISTKVTTAFNVPEMTSKIIVPETVKMTVETADVEMGSAAIESETYTADNGLVDKNDNVKFIATPTSEYRFSNWTSNGSVYSTLNPLTIMATTDIDLVANFVIDEYKVTFKVDGVEYASGMQHHGRIVQVPETDPSKIGYTFTGWSGVTDETTVPDHDVTYSAVFTINQYNVKFVAKGTEVYNKNMNYASPITKPTNPTFTGYMFISWGDVPATVPDHDVVFTADYLLLGDVYEDDILDVTDITAIAGAILDNAATLTDRQFMAADLCEDDVIDVTDYTIGVGLVLDATGDVNARPAMAPSVSQDKAKLILNNCVLDGNEGVLCISMDNGGDQIANIQFDIDLPMGINIDDLSLTSRSRNGHGIDYLEQKDGSVRVLIYSNNNTAIRDSEGVILELVLSNDLPLVGDYDIAMKNIVLARENRTGIHQDECHALLSCDNVSGLSTVADNGLKIVVGRGYVQISSDSEQTVFVHNVAGICVGQTLTNSIPTKIELPAGIYMINGKRISIK